MSQVSSNPLAVRVCNHWGDTGSEIVHVYPGQSFKVLVVLYGQRNGSVPGIVRANLFKGSRDTHLAPLQETQEMGYVCENLTYTIFSTGHHELILLRVDGGQYYVWESWIIINATLLLPFLLS